MQPSLRLFLVVSSLAALSSSFAQGAKTLPPEERKAAASGLTANAVKAFVTRKEKLLADNVGSNHKSVTLTFESVRFGASRTATARDRVVNGITGKVVFPVRVRYVSHRVWGNGGKEDRSIYYGYEFYKDEFGEWNANLTGPVQ